MILEEVALPAADGSALRGDLALPASVPVMVVFAHGSGSSRHSPRNRVVAAALRRAGMGTLLMDLLTEREERHDLLTAEYRFDIGLLSSRVVAAVDWLAGLPATRTLGVGLFGASTGAAAALRAAAERPARVRSVVSRGGRPDLAGDALARVAAPVLLIVGGEDPEVLRLNREAAGRLAAPHRVEVVPGAGHLFEEPGALEHVVRAAREWFRRPGGDAPGAPGGRT
ncbi:dienelactone hydrolase family protein [Streptomyces somaliensis DSM 40738]|uniref:Dienelactone hydrolase family protein n=1 Tax=Streptomyces somaliensis (strain ATCC 33201 / DSM 40738 / JCM 12659 / KCTC 9044 / NCTC 11332 / NRRL B-12077 / IP 733) TaxID=1134445 RepID=A0AA44DDZ9_STRE0|nr:dienelactone hydrolase family protein [Streptomyces somaliensis]MCQ0025030.1 dienelactone hydrolase family protein [Streptomyces somaliensis DSM 40738]NKY14744.1 dienelactone hydrolase family protein [Streptomyces somaliensis DSM 40738]